MKRIWYPHVTNTFKQTLPSSTARIDKHVTSPYNVNKEPLSSKQGMLIEMHQPDEGILIYTQTFVAFE